MLIWLLSNYWPSLSIGICQSSTWHLCSGFRNYFSHSSKELAYSHSPGNISDLRKSSELLAVVLQTSRPGCRILGGGSLLVWDLTTALPCRSLSEFSSCHDNLRNVLLFCSLGPSKRWELVVLDPHGDCLLLDCMVALALKPSVFLIPLNGLTPGLLSVPKSLPFLPQGLCSNHFPAWISLHMTFSSSKL